MLSRKSLAEKSVRFTTWWASLGAVTTEMILHKRFGKRYLSVLGSLAVLQCGAIFFLCGMYHELTRDPRADPVPLFVFWLLYLLFYLDAIYFAIKSHWRGEIEHTRYNGRPRLLPQRLARFERSFKTIFEPSLAGFIGWSIFQWNWPLGAYLLFNAICMFWEGAANFRFERRRAMDLQDAVIEQRVSTHVLRNLTGR